MRRGFPILVALLLAAFATSLATRAEVSAETDSAGRYARMIVLTNNSVKNLKIWTMQRSNANVHPLNENGDAYGDLFPTIAENPFDGRNPWVVWSRFNGLDYDLGGSRWRSGGWTAISWVEPAPDAGDALAPRIDFDVHGRPYLAWWSEEGGQGRVYFSLFLQTRWMTPLLVSTDDVDARNADIEVLSDSEIRVEYDTPEGRVERHILIDRPTTITDDIDPFSQFYVSGSTPVNDTYGSN